MSRAPFQRALRLLRLAQFGWGGEGFRDGLPFLLAGEAKVGTVSGMVGLMAVTVRLAAGAARGGDRSAAKVGQSSHFLKDTAALLFQLMKRFSHGHSPYEDNPTCPNVLLR